MPTILLCATSGLLVGAVLAGIGLNFWAVVITCTVAGGMVGAWLARKGY